MQLLVLVIFLIISLPAHAAQPACEWQEGTGAAFAEDISANEAQKLARNRARFDAVEKIAGVQISGATLVKDSILLTDIVASLSEGFIEKEQEIVWDSKLLSPGPGKPEIPFYTAAVKVCVAADRGEKDTYFTLSATTDQPVYTTGEEMSLDIRAGKEAHLAVFHVDDKEQVTVLMPCRYQDSFCATAAKNVTFPPDGFGLRAKLPPGVKKSVESFIVVGTRERYDYAGAFGNKEQLDLATLFKTIRSISAASRAMAITSFEIRGK